MNIVNIVLILMASLQCNDAEWVTTAEGNKLRVVDMDETFGLFTKGGVFDKYELEEEDSIGFPTFIVRSNFELPDDVSCVRITFRCNFNYRENVDTFIIWPDHYYYVELHYKNRKSIRLPSFYYGGSDIDDDYPSYPRNTKEFKIADKVCQYARKLTQAENKSKEVGEYCTSLLRMFLKKNPYILKRYHVVTYPARCYIYNSDMIQNGMSLEYPSLER